MSNYKGFKLSRFRLLIIILFPTLPKGRCHLVNPEKFAYIWFVVLSLLSVYIVSNL